MIPTHAELNQRLVKLYECLDTIRDKTDVIWTRKQEALEKLANIPIERRHYAEWNDATHAIHDAVVNLKMLYEIKEDTNKEVIEVQHLIRKHYPIKPIEIPKSVIKRSKYYEGDDA